MGDWELRELARTFERTRDPEDELRWLTARARCGDLDWDAYGRLHPLDLEQAAAYLRALLEGGALSSARLELAAAAGHGAALRVLGLSCPQDLLSDDHSSWEESDPLRPVLVALYRRDDPRASLAAALAAVSCAWDPAVCPPALSPLAERCLSAALRAWAQPETLDGETTTELAHSLSRATDELIRKRREEEEFPLTEPRSIHRDLGGVRAVLAVLRTALGGGAFCASEALYEARDRRLPRALTRACLFGPELPPS
ncbi:MAG: hypothetical protein AB7N76_05650 [Planctomycetota bacterium]